MTDYTLFVYANEKLRRIYFNHVYIIYGCYISIIFNTTEKMLLEDEVGTTFIMLKYFALPHLLALKNIHILSLSDFNAVENVS